MTLCNAWTPDYDTDVCVPCDSYDFPVDPDLYDQFLAQASEILYHLSGQQFPGICTQTITPCAPVGSPYLFTQFSPYVTANIRQLTPADPFPWACGCAGPTICNCDRLPAIHLPSGPIVEVTEVITTDDGTLDPSAYELRDDYLLRIDGDRWPCCDDGFRITYTFGTNPPITGLTAAAVLACELMVSCYPDQFPNVKCRLPRNISAISRQGVSVLFDSLTNSNRRFRFGILEIDLFLETVNPHNLTSPSIILSPDTMNIARKIP